MSRIPTVEGMMTLGTIFLAVATAISITNTALAGSNSVGISVTSDRVEDDLSAPQSTKVDLSASHTFDVGITLGGSLQYSNTAFSDAATLNVETTLGYRLHVNKILSVVGSVGIGERMQLSGTGDDIAYYVLRSSADLKVNDILTWNAVAFRYRDAFDAADDYLTPQLATGFTFKLDQHNSISTKVQYNWKDWNPDTIGFALGYQYDF